MPLCLNLWGSIVLWRALNQISSILSIFGSRCRSHSSVGLTLRAMLNDVNILFLLVLIVNLFNANTAC